MADIENKYYEVSSDGVYSQSVISRRWFKDPVKVGVTLMAGSCFMLLSCVASPASSRALHSARAAESTNLVGMSPSLRMNPMQRTGAAMVPRGIGQNLNIHDTGLSGLKKYAREQWEANIRSNMRDMSMKAETLNENQEIDAVRAAAEEAKKEMEEMEKKVKLKAEDMAGVTAPLGFWDPLGFSTDCDSGKLLFYREVELKHGRVGMLASLGFLVGENFHPLFGGNIDVPSYVAFQQTPLQQFWPAVLLAISIPEIFSVFTFQSPFGMNILDQMWKINPEHESGNLGFDPLGLKPTDPKELKEMQTKELNNGRLAMIAAAGMIAQELATGEKLF